MKRSNIIILIFLGFFIIATLVFYIDGKKKENRTMHGKSSNVEYKDIQLSSYAVVVAEDSADVHILESDTSRIRIEYKKGTSPKLDVYKLANDTLYVYKGQRLYVSGNRLKHIIGKKAFWIGVHNLTNADSLDITTEGGVVVLNTDEKPFKLEKLNLKALKTEFTSYNGMNVKKLNIDFENSGMTMQNASLDQVTINLKNKSSFVSYGDSRINEISSKKDESSKLNVY